MKNKNMYRTFPNIWWLNTNIADGHARAAHEGDTHSKLEQAFLNDTGDIKRLTGCESFDELVNKVKEIHVQDISAEDTDDIKLPIVRTPYLVKNGCIGIGFGFYVDPSDKANQLRDELSKQVEQYARDIEDPKTKKGITKKAYSEKIGTSVEDKADSPGSTSSTLFQYVTQMVCDVKPGDLIWMRNKEDGTYYLGQVTEDSKWRSIHSQDEMIVDPEAVYYDIAHQYSNIIWSTPITIAQVPGSVVAASTGQQRSFHGIGQDGDSSKVTSQWLSMMLMNEQIDAGVDGCKYDMEYIMSNLEDEKKLSNTPECFYRILSADDVEDLLALWLYDKKRYIVFPSTNKTETAGYEFEMVCPSGPNVGSRCYIQCKNGNINKKLDVADYEELSKIGEVYILVTVEPTQNILGMPTTDGDKCLVSPDMLPNVHCFTQAGSEQLFQWAQDNRTWLTDRIRFAIELLEEYGV